MSSVTCDIERVANIENSVFLHFSEILMLFLSILAIPITLWAFVKCIRTSFFHINIRLIGGLHCVCLLIHCFGRFIQHFSSLYLWMSSLPECDKQHYVNTCLIAHSMYNFGMYSSSCTSVLMVVERTVATKYYKKYQNKSWHLGVFLVVFQILLSFLITFMFSKNSDFGERPIYCFSDNQLEWALSCKFLMILLNVLALLQCWRLDRINRHLRVNNNVTDLTQKFQVEENKTLVKVMIRFTILDFVFMVAFFLFGFLVQIWSKTFEEPVFLGVFELIHCVPVYAIVVLISMAITIRNIQNKKTEKIFEEVQIKDEAYFEWIQKQWA